MRNEQPQAFLGGCFKGTKTLVEGKESQDVLFLNLLSKQDLAQGLFPPLNSDP